MKVYQVNVTGRFSTGNIAKAIHQALIDNGDEARFAFGYGGNVEKGFLQSNDIWHQRFDSRFQQIFGIEGAFSGKSTDKIIRDIQIFSPDIIHLHNIHGNYLNFKKIMTFLGEYKKPVLLTLHDCWAYTGGCYHYTVNNCSQWKQNCRECSFIRHGKCSIGSSYTEYREKKELFNNIEDLEVSTVSSWLCEEASQSFFGNRTINTICNGIDINVFKPKDSAYLKKELGCDGKAVLLGVASTWNERKGLLRWQQLAEEIPDKYTIVLVGLHPYQISSLANNDNIIALPRSNSQEELCVLYNMADIYINLSKEETFGLPTVEAMACGTPAIVINSTANPELITPETGIVVDSDDESTLLNAVETICRKNQDGIMSKACIEHVRDRYSKEVMTGSYLSCYHRMLDKYNR